MFRCVRSTWMIPSKATLKLSRIEGGRRPGAGLTLQPYVACQGEQRRSRWLLQRSRWILRCSNPREDHALAALHLVTVLEAEQVENPVHERPAPLLGDDLGADHDVAECAWHPVRQLIETVDRKREDVGGLVHAEMLSLQHADLVRRHPGDPELGLLDPLDGQGMPREVDRARHVDLDAAAVLDLDLDHFLRAVPVSSAWRLYASTIRCTSLCRTTSSCPTSTTPMPSTSRRMSRTWIRPDACSRGRSIWVMSPVTTIFEPKPSRVRNISICSGVVFCASSRMMNESLSVRPRMKASGATSIVPRSISRATTSASSMSYSAS